MKFRLNEELKTNAVMLRRDGKAISTTIHPYGSPSDSEFYDVLETVAVSEWLYKNTAKSSTKRDVESFLSAWAEDNSLNSPESVVKYLKELPYRVITDEFARNINIGDFSGDVDELNDKVCKDLNSEFIRVRNGGAYNTSSANKGEVTFRICPSRFNWFDVIWAYVYDNRNTIKSVTIVHDDESYGDDSPYEVKGKRIVSMPVDEFINLPGNPIIEKIEGEN